MIFPSFSKLVKQKLGIIQTIVRVCIYILIYYLPAKIALFVSVSILSCENT